MVKLKCKICGNDFNERAGLPGLKCCENCDYTGRSGIAKRGNIWQRGSG
jgi:hypothetical protein